MCETASLTPRLDSLCVSDVTTHLSDVTTDLGWVEGGTEDGYMKGGLPAVDCIDGDGKTLRLRSANGLLLSPNVSPDILDRFNTVSARHNDVLIATYPKCGTHWMWEIVSMLKKGSGTLLTDTIQHVDFLPLNMLDELSSPRVLATHMPFPRIPRDFLSKGCKVIWVVRNPWDVAVSYYNFIKKIKVFGYTGDWNGFFELFLDGNVPYNSWFEHTVDWLKGMETTPNILMIRYEDLHINFKKEVLRIADYLNIPVTDELLDTLQSETSFANMSQKKVDVSLPISTDGTSPVYRKGKCGDWLNWFTEQQSAELKGAYRVAVGAYNRILQYSNRLSQTSA